MAAIKVPVGEERPASARHHKQAGELTRHIQGPGNIARAAALEQLEQTRSDASLPGDHVQDNVCDAAHTLARYVAQRRSRRR